MKAIQWFLYSLLLAGCATGASQPEWINTQPRDYPASRYLTASGSASSEEAARMAALANLAKIFEVQVNETSRDEASAWQLTGEDNASLQGGSQLTARYVDTFTTKMLEGAQIAQTFRARDGTHYALAVLARGQLSERLAGEIRAADQHVATLLRRAAGAKEPFFAAQAIYRARQLLLQREMLQRDLQIVDASGAGVKPQWHAGELAVEVDKMLSRITSASSVEQDSVGNLADMLPAAVTALGAHYDPASKAYLLQAGLDVEDLGQRDGWYWYRGALQVKLLRPADGLVLASTRMDLKASGQTKDQARVRLQDQIAQKLNVQLKAALLGFGSGDDKTKNSTQ